MEKYKYSFTEFTNAPVDTIIIYVVQKLKQIYYFAKVKKAF